MKVKLMVKGGQKRLVPKSGKHKKLTKWLGLLLCLMAGSVWSQTTADLDAEQKKLDDEWREQFWVYLETSEYPHFRTRAAIRLIRTGDPKAIEEGELLINEVLDELSPDPASLWVLASACPGRGSAEWCEPGGVYALLEKADPHNAAVYVLRFNHNSAEDDSLLDTEANRQLLYKAAEADHFDFYWGRGTEKLYEEALKFIDIHPMQFTPESEEMLLKFNMTPKLAAFYAAANVFVSAPNMSWSQLVELCRLQSRSRRAEGIIACKKLSDTLRNHGYSMMTRGIGYALEKYMLTELDPNDPGIRQWQIRGYIFSVMQMCFLPYWQVNMEIQSDAIEPSIKRWVKNISEFGEWEGTRLSAFEDYRASPEHFIVNPVDCDKLKDLDDEAMERFINNQGPGEAWRAMQDEARSNQTQATTTTK
jgi:hypothetical protein